MSDHARSTIARSAGLGVILLALVIAAYGLYLVLVGVTAVSTPAIPEGTPPGPTSMESTPAVQGVMPTVAGGLVLIGLVLRRLWLAWAGALVVSLFAGLFAFGIGGVLLPVAIPLLVLLGIVTWTGAPRIGRSSSA